MDNFDEYGRIIRSDNSQARIKELENQIRNLQEQVRNSQNSYNYLSNEYNNYVNYNADKEIAKIADVGTVLLVISGIIGIIITFMSHWFFGIVLILMSILWLLVKENDDFRTWFIDTFDL